VPLRIAVSMDLCVVGALAPVFPVPTALRTRRMLRGYVCLRSSYFFQYTAPSHRIW
jgi:hypothetical protein